MTGKNRLWPVFYNPVGQNDRQRKSLARPLTDTIQFVDLFFRDKYHPKMRYSSKSG